MRKLHFLAFLALLATVALVLPPASSAQLVVGVSVRVGPPPLRVYEQPACPGPGYLWTPGYWAYGPAGYYWVAGAWVMPPSVGLLWTPGYWGWEGGYYHWHRGYWGSHVGFYGGINYGFGYFGTGFAGGHWDHDHFYYNSAVWHVDRRLVHRTYEDRREIREMHGHRVSYNGGRGGIDARPNRDERAYEQERHFDRTPMQVHHEESFRRGERGGNAFHSFTPPNHGARNDMARPNDRGNHGNVGYGKESRPNHSFARPNNDVNHGARNDMARPNDRGRGNGGQIREVRPNPGGNHGGYTGNPKQGREGGPKVKEKPTGGPRHEGRPQHQRR
jgi:WXXGXW repeat (2 copies)